MYSEDDLLQLSGLQHYSFCPRQCALIHIEKLWEENLFTVEGELFHERVHQEHGEKRKHQEVQFSLPLVSYQLGLSGQADIVEFLYQDAKRTLLQEVIPVEYKRGKPKSSNVDKVQLCALGICLEEMLSFPIEKGFLYYGKTKKRHEVIFSDKLKQEVIETAKGFHQLVAKAKIPAAVAQPHCKSCSFIDICLPSVRTDAVKDYVQREVCRAMEDTR